VINQGQYAVISALLLAIALVGCREVSVESPATQAALYPRIDLQKDCGAKGDGMANDTAAFQKAAAWIQKAGGGTLMIPRATYMVGKQEHVAGQTPYYQPAQVFMVKGVNFLLIEGHGATLRCAPGLRYGSFDPTTGAVYNPSKMPFTDYNYVAQAVPMFNISNSRHVTIHDVELDGNSPHFILGGSWGDTGRQLGGDGILLFGNTDVQVSYVQSHHHPRDGMMIGWPGLKESAPATPHTLTDCAFEFNGRQGLSWVGGRGLHARRCQFNHTGRAMVGGANLCSAPAAGLDIEAEDSVCRDGDFADCAFINNAGCGMVADSGDGGYTTFVRCTFWGTTSWSAWSSKPGLKYENCNFHGSIVHAHGAPDPALATRWIGCTFDDQPWKDGPRPYGRFLVEINGPLPNVTFDACTFTAHARQSVWCSGAGVQFSACTFTHKNAALGTGEFQGLIRGSVLRGCCFNEDFPPATKASWYIAAEGTRIVDGKPTTVDGPCVHWGRPGGALGRLPPTPEPK